MMKEDVCAYQKSEKQIHPFPFSVYPPYVSSFVIVCHCSENLAEIFHFDTYFSYFPISTHPIPEYLGTYGYYPRQHYINNVNCIKGAFVVSIIMALCPQYHRGICPQYNGAFVHSIIGALFPQGLALG